MAGPIQNAAGRAMVATGNLASKIGNTVFQMTGDAMNEKAQVAEQQEAEKQQKQHNEEQALLAEQQAHEAKADIIKLTGEQEAANKELQEKKATSDKMAKGGRGNTKEKYQAALTETEAAQRAFDELSEKMQARQAMLARAEAVMQHRRGQ